MRRSQPWDFASGAARELCMLFLRMRAFVVSLRGIRWPGSHSRLLVGELAPTVALRRLHVRSGQISAAA